MNQVEASGLEGVVLEPQGPRLSIQNAHLLTEDARARIADGAQKLVIDLGQIEFVDSSGIGALVGLRKALPDGEVSLTNVRSFVSLVLTKTQTARLFTISEP